jgi:hypothetical protein
MTAQVRTIEVVEEAPREGLAEKILRAPGRGLAKAGKYILENPWKTASTAVGVTSLIAGAHHLGLWQQLSSMAPAGGFQTFLQRTGATLHRGYGNFGSAVLERMPSAVSTPVRWLFDTTNLSTPRP